MVRYGRLTAGGGFFGPNGETRVFPRGTIVIVGRINSDEKDDRRWLNVRIAEEPMFERSFLTRPRVQLLSPLEMLASQALVH